MSFVPPLPVINDVYRVTVPWSQSGGISPINVFHIRTTSTDFAAIATAIGDATPTGNLWEAMGSGFQALSVELLALDGSTATQAEPLGTTWAGGASGENIPQACALVSLRTAQRGARGRGRVYVGPITEGRQNDGTLLSTSQNEMVTAWGDFIASLAGGTPSIELGVASYTHADFHPVVSHRVDTIIATQRRRLDQLR